MQAIFQIHIREVSKNKNTIIETGLLRPFLVKIVFAKEKDAFFFYKERIQNPKLMTLSIYAVSKQIYLSSGNDLETDFLYSMNKITL